ncbi:U2 small nuclear ribonucleoprotein B'' [Smittium culicis]|uniref:U2 small nuclear ribonucleoprotein B n=1 Tax=Smittium culicis TaxID=133412 RepID=A0A1R1YPF8_9FUNG|nr:U2 small nuclear ribonucleoprotein B'' [Smittium culicis]
MASIPPNQTIHIGNLNSKIKNHELRSSLYYLCISYGRIVDISFPKRTAFRGQAFVSFRDISSATIAKRQLDGFDFYSKSLKINYAKSKSDAVGMLDGSYFSENVRYERMKKKRMGNNVSESEVLGENQEEETISEVDMESDSDEDSIPLTKRTHENSVIDADNLSKKQKISDDVDNIDLKNTESDNSEQLVASNTLFLENLPEAVTTEMLATLFQQYPGFREIRRVPGKKNLAFVDYDTPDQAAISLDVLQGFKLTPENPMLISYAKK